MIGTFLAVATVLQAAPDAPSKIVFYRGSSIVGAAVACPIRWKGREVVELARGKYAEWSVPPGRYLLTNHTASVEVSVAAGETRYVRCQIKSGIMSGRADLQLVDEESYREQKGLERKEPHLSPDP
jgi:hypothetical protein